MIFFAATALEKIKEVPVSFWIKVSLIIGGFMLAVLVLRWLGQANKLIIGVVTFITVSIIGLSWVYNRNEPAFMTPTVEFFAQWLPTKGAYDNKQQEDPSKPGIRKNPSKNPEKKPAKPSQPTEKK